MKRKCTRLVLLFLLTVALCSITALAAGEKGVYNVQSNDDSPIAVTITPKTATEGNPEIKQVTVNNNSVDLAVNAERFEITVDSSNSTNQYLVLMTKGGAADVPSEANIVYIDQKAGSELPFNAYPSSLSKGEYSVWLASSEQGVINGKPAGSFQYYESFTLGEVDGVKGITSRDALYTLQHSVHTRELTGEYLLAAEVDGTKGISARDALYILQASVKTRVLGN